MKRKKWTSLLYSRGLPLLLTILLLGGGFGTYISASARAMPSAGYDGETIFRGLLFGSGPVAELFPEIWDNPQVTAALRGQSEAQAQEAADMQNRMVAWIKGQDSTFFDRFGLDLQSGDHLRIEQALKEAYQFTLEALSAELGVSLEDLTRLPEAIGVAVIYVLAFVVAVAAAAVAIVFVNYVISFAEDSEASSLQRDMWINLIATRLGSN